MTIHELPILQKNVYYDCTEDQIREIASILELDDIQIGRDELVFATYESLKTYNILFSPAKQYTEYSGECGDPKKLLKTLRSFGKKNIFHKIFNNLFG